MAGVEEASEAWQASHLRCAATILMDIGGYWRRIGGSDDVGRAWVTWEKQVGLHDASAWLSSSGSSL